MKNKIIFLDIDGVLNDCSGAIMQDSGIKRLCVDNLNHILRKTNSKIILISTWTDLGYPLDNIIQFLYSRGVIGLSIITHSFPQKEDGDFIIPMSKAEKIRSYLTEFGDNIESYVIIDDGEISEDFKSVHVKPVSTVGMLSKESELAISILG